MLKKIILMLLVTVLSSALYAQDAKTTLEKAAQAIGAANLKSVQFSGSGANFAVGQSHTPGEAWPKFTIKSYNRVINYETASSREEIVRTQGENPARGGGGQPMAGEQRQVALVSGKYAWNLMGNNANPALGNLIERQLSILTTPHGFVKAALASNATAKTRTISGKKVTVISFTSAEGFKLSGVINEQGFVDSIENWLANTVLGDMLVETNFSDYRDFQGVKFPARIVQKQGGFPALDLTVSEVKPNVASDIQAPDNVRNATAPPVRVESAKLADGVWYLTGGPHHSVAIEFKDHAVVIEGPLNEDRSLAVIAEVKKLIPNKPLKYLINTHHHFDHSGGIRTFAAEGVTILTHQINKPFYERAFKASRTLAADKLAQSGKKARFETMTDKRVLTDGTRTLELHLIQGSTHNGGILMGYLPKEKILIEADVFTPGPPNAPTPATLNPFTTNLYDNLQRLKLDVAQIAPLHGRLVPYNELLKNIGKAQ